ncbi:tyrosine--tRNA ligase [Clostridium sp. 'deep sea']|uniref:tyrosine--tRNA ligase n=1 Tax=Clostridium sp. 'deep sea' TaxID=2779445 RepID=UPI00189671F5|nr:tyrosine--tRNA ligase [Clostridium sp. 'deep sea']QOR35566.1 tyrosine--tRNA ligase [Clostridium sp. 'deep sea']
MNNVYDVLIERGYIEQASHPEEIKEILAKEKVTFYIGFDPTAESLHIGHFLQIMVIKHMQAAGHQPIILLGGGTTMVGDPTGKTDMRKMLTKKDIFANANKFGDYFKKYVDFSDNKALILNNADWLLELNYVDFLREVGVHFSVNRMLTAECYKSRLEKGLSFLEFNYMLMQSYDFLHLYRNYNCTMQFGGNDQWSNILGGVDLVRRKERGLSFALTFALLTNSDGKKMGKTEKGAIWLDAEKTSPYEFYQYWRNIEDGSIKKCLALMTFLPMTEVNRLGNLEGAEINKAKEVLAYETTKIVHGEDEANKAREASKALFSKGTNMTDVPNTEISTLEINEGISLLDLLLKTGLVATKSEARRLIKQNGISVNDKKVSDPFRVVNTADFNDNTLMLRKGKKVYHQVRLTNNDN